MIIFSIIYKFTLWLFMIAFIYNTIYMCFIKEKKDKKYTELYEGFYVCVKELAETYKELERIKNEKRK